MRNCPSPTVHLPILGSNIRRVYDRLLRGLAALRHSFLEHAQRDFMVSPKWGYLTSCPTNLGTGMRASVHILLEGWVGRSVGKEGTLGQNSQESGRKYRATRSSVRSFARTAESLACSALLASLAHSAALIHLLARSLTPKLAGK